VSLSHDDGDGMRAQMWPNDCRSRVCESGKGASDCLRICPLAKFSSVRICGVALRISA